MGKGSGRSAGKAMQYRRMHSDCTIKAVSITFLPAYFYDKSKRFWAWYSSIREAHSKESTQNIVPSLLRIRCLSAYLQFPRSSFDAMDKPKQVPRT